MSYEKQTWATGDIVTADKLNHMEDGIAENATGGYDLVIKLNNGALGSVSTASIEQGTYADAKAKALGGEPLDVLVYGITDDGEVFIITKFGVKEISFSTVDESQYISVCVDSTGDIVGYIDISADSVTFSLD